MKHFATACIEEPQIDAIDTTEWLPVYEAADGVDHRLPAISGQPRPTVFWWPSGAIARRICRTQPACSDTVAPPTPGPTRTTAHSVGLRVARRRECGSAAAASSPTGSTREPAPALRAPPSVPVEASRARPGNACSAL